MSRKKPLPRSQRKIVNRALQHKRDDKIQDISVSLMDMDSTIMYYFENVIKPSVVENGETIKVPIMYSSPERWSTVQKSGFMRETLNDRLYYLQLHLDEPGWKKMTQCQLIRWIQKIQSYIIHLKENSTHETDMIIFQFNRDYYHKENIIM
jgi:hypothetical protein